MTLPRSTRQLELLLLFTVLAGAAAAQVPESAGIQPAAPGDTLRDATGQFVVEISVEPVAGETLQAGAFAVEFLGNPTAEPPGEAIFSDGFESSGVTP